jgi:hypothetical protein
VSTAAAISMGGGVRDLAEIVGVRPGDGHAQAVPVATRHDVVKARSAGTTSPGTSGARRREVRVNGLTAW